MGRIFTEKDYEGISFNQVAVDAEMEIFLANHPLASQEEIWDYKRTLIGREAVLDSMLQLLEKTDPQLQSPQTRKAREAEIREKIKQEPQKYADFAFFGQYTNSNSFDFLRQHQRTMLLVKTPAEYQATINVAYSRLCLGLENPDFNPYLIARKRAENTHRGLFAPTTDRSGLPFNEIDLGSASKNALYDWQDQIDAVVIPTEDYTDDFIELAVFGSCMKDENIIESKEYAYQTGSSIPKEADVYSSLRTFYFENILNGDKRYNTHAFRSIVAKSRSLVRQDILSKNESSLLTDIKSAFDTCYTVAMESRNVNKAKYGYSVHMMDKVLSVLQRKGMSPESIGISEQQLQNYQVLKAKERLVHRLEAVKSKVRSYAPDVHFLGALSEKNDYQKNKELQDLILESHAISSCISMMEKDVSEYITSIASHASDSTHDIANRKILPSEVICYKDLDAFIETKKHECASSPDFKKLQTEVNALELERVLLDGDYTVKADAKHFPGFPEDFEQHCAENTLSSLFSLVKEEQTRFLSEAKNNHDATQKQSALTNAKTLTAISSYMQKTILLRNKMSKPITEKNMGLLAQRYEKTASAVRSFIFDQPENYLRGPFVANTRGYVEALSSQNDAVARKDEYRKYLHSCAVTYENIRNIRQLGSVQNYSDYLKKLQSLVGKQPGPIVSIVDQLATTKDTLAKTPLTAKVFGDVQLSQQSLSTSITAFLNKPKKTSLEKQCAYVLQQFQRSTKQENILLTSLQLSDSSKLSMEQQVIHAKTNAIPDPYTAMLSQIQPYVERLEKISSRFGGNSLEFTALLKDAKELSKATKNTYEQCAQKLSASSKAYIRTKSIVPQTATGRERLNVAHDFLDVCNQILPIVEQQRYENHTALKEPTYRNSMEKVQRLKEHSRQEIEDSLANTGDFKTVEAVESYLYYSRLEVNMKDMSEAAIQEALKPATVLEEKNKLKLDAMESLQAISKKELKKTIQTGKLSEIFKPVIQKGIQPSSSDQKDVKKDKNTVSPSIGKR